MKNIVIYGAGNYGRQVLNILQKTKSIHIAMICDSDEKKWGTKLGSHIINPPSKIFELENLDGIFIAILSENNVETYILSKKRIKIYHKINELVVESIYWDISGRCNARCKYCVTGRNNRYNKFKYEKNSYMTFDVFKKNYQHLYRKGIISKESQLGLFNWKEPFLNPDIIEILSYCSKVGQRYNLSTNASVVKFASDKNTYSKCDLIYFSMPGFSQESYERIHGFKFEIIKKNIISIKNDMIDHGFTGKFVISAHIYKFSEKEIEYLKDWAKKEDILVYSYYPYLAGNSLMEEYFENKLDQKTKEDISSELFLPWDIEINQESIDKFVNPLCHQLTVDEKGNLTLCCAADEFCDDYNRWGKVEDLDSYEDYKTLKEKMLKSKTCAQCKKYALAYRILTVK